eukprot:3837609-Prymnesium_polylepis.3
MRLGVAFARRDSGSVEDSGDRAHLEQWHVMQSGPLQHGGSVGCLCLCMTRCLCVIGVFG